MNSYAMSQRVDAEREIRCVPDREGWSVQVQVVLPSRVMVVISLVLPGTGFRCAACGREVAA